jgi:hypothetical protein
VAAGPNFSPTREIAYFRNDTRRHTLFSLSHNQLCALSIKSPTLPSLRVVETGTGPYSRTTLTGIVHDY